MKRASFGFVFFIGLCVYSINFGGSQVIVFFSTAEAVSSTPYVDFNDFPVTPSDGVPGSSDDWIYTTARTNPSAAYYMTAYDSAGWRTQAGYPAPDTSVHDLFYRYASAAYNSAHMGFETYGYLEIDGNRAVLGNSLRYQATGGKNSNTCPDGNSGALPCNASGLPVATKEQFLDYLAGNQDPVEGDQAVGHPYLYFANTSPNDNSVPFVQATGNNRLSLYVYLPDSLDNGSGGSANPPAITFNVGPYNGEGGHWYHHYTLQGGGWAHVIVDGHPQHNNAYSSAALYPYPSSSLRDMGVSYFNTLYRWYMTAKPYEGIAVPTYSVWVDEIEYRLDTEPQNHETIASPSIMYRVQDNRFEIGFMDKYKNNGKSYATFEVRYSFGEITNASWHLATPVLIQEDSRFGIAARSDGKFQKWWPYYQNVWAPFKLLPQDEALLDPGTTVYFAIKDISQTGGNGMTPVASLDGTPGKGGRDYETYGDTFDYAGDAPVLTLIKRIDYLIPKAESICPECNGDQVRLRNITYGSGTVCECTAGISIEAGPGFRVESGADITLKAPEVLLKPGVMIEAGGSFHVSQ